jgi:hypothetical protein
MGDRRISPARLQSIGLSQGRCHAGTAGACFNRAEAARWSRVAHVWRAGQLLAPISWRKELRASARVRGMLV